MNPDKLIIGTRGSALALWQTNHVARRLKAAHPGLVLEIVKIKTTGDKITDTALSRIGGKGLFTKELEQALIDGQIDLCVHSMKDVPTELPEGLVLTAMLERADVRDALVLRPGLAGEGAGLEALPEGARVGTSALRRQAQLRALRSDLELVDLRGNLDTRLRKVAEGAYDAAVLASAGISRMGWAEQISAYLPCELVLPACAQGAIGIECRADDVAVRTLCAPLADAPTMAAVNAERQVMAALDGGCQTPFAAYGRFEQVATAPTGATGSAGSSTDTNLFKLTSLVASVDGQTVLTAEGTCDLPAVADLGDAAVQHAITQTATQVIADLLTQGAAQIMEEARYQ
ncbi:MAG: hydroxymethylbilane synthase [Coriobacteriales bacterium]|jgi:hydroxymethylbilane synthase|nr:hydroxymethylbilane synthase [Coriobacteriales bacterium]